MAILSGGESRRFKKGERNEDKALMKIGAKPLLLKLVEEGITNYDDVIISLNTYQKRIQYAKLLEQLGKNNRIQFVQDNPDINFEGVGKGIASVLLKRKEKTSIQFMPCDRPYLDTKLLKNLKSVTEGVTILIYNNGMIEPLLGLYDANYEFPSKFFFELNLSRADVFIRLAPNIRFYDISKIIELNNLNNTFFLNVNKPTDVGLGPVLPKETYLLPRSKVIKRNRIKYFELDEKESNFNRKIDFLIEEHHHFLAFLLVKFLYKNQQINSDQFRSYVKSILLLEHEYWMHNNMPFLGLHALQDLSKHLNNKIPDEIDTKIRELKRTLNIKKR